MPFDAENFELVTTLAPVSTESQLLLDAASLIEKGGWCQYKMRQFGQRCAIGALLDVEQQQTDPPEWARAVYALTERVAGSIPDWNDKPGQTAENVMQTMREVARGL